ncbi:hypothetical protein [Deinococcus aestuarii]|uniref:hypothetical protein n=1 Tax=Deinococcus aestuarii TaxID=2774531 RepID=UPI001C0BD01E|nr:hypothetical protein [Deinococcus aestuarii]
MPPVSPGDPGGAGAAGVVRRGAVGHGQEAARKTAARKGGGRQPAVGRVLRSSVNL